MTLYERINFKHSDTQSDSEWIKTHEDALAKPEKYDHKYTQLLQEINALRTEVDKMEKNNKKTALPTTKENNVCVVDFFPELDNRLKILNQMLSETEDASWD